MTIATLDVNLEVKGKTTKVLDPISNYQPSDAVKDRISLIRTSFTSSYAIFNKPRREFNDMSYYDRMSIDQMAWAVYQPNDGDALEGDQINSWRSNAIRPITRNKIFSIAAHVTARTLFPKIAAFDKESNEQEDAAQVMQDLIEWSTFGSNSAYADVSLQAVISALVNPVSIVQTQFVEVWREVKRDKVGGKWRTERMLDEDLSGFIDEVVPPEQIFVQDFFQPDIQKQGYVIRRRVRPYSLCKTLYGHYEDFVYVKPGVQTIFNDANGNQFYDVYDNELRQDECEEVLFWNKSLDIYQILVNGILLTDPDEANPREDKLYPFAAFGYQALRASGDCFCYKSLAFLTGPDDKIVNTLYPMIIDGTYLAIMPPMISLGGEIITSDVIVPGGVTTFSSPDADLKPIAVQNENLKAGMDALFKVEQNITDDAFQPLMNGDLPEGGGNMPAYTMSRLEATQKLMLGPFVDMVGKYVKQMGRLRIGDIKQHMTLPEITAIEGSANADLVYKTFVLAQNKSRAKSHKIQFSADLPDTMSEDDHMQRSYDVLKQEGGVNGKGKLSLVNPTLFRDLKYLTLVGTDILMPMSEELEQRYALDEYDKMIAAPNLYDPEETAKLLLGAFPATRRHPDQYVAKNPSMGEPPMQPGMQNGQPQLSPQQQMQPLQQ